MSTVDASVANAAAGKTTATVTNWWKFQATGKFREKLDMMDVLDISCFANDNLGSNTKAGNFCVTSSLTLAAEGGVNA